MRDRIKNINYFEEYIKTNHFLLENGINLLNQGKVLPAQIESFKHSIYGKQLADILANYSVGTDLHELKQKLIKLTETINKYWSSINSKLITDNKIYNQYILGAYDEMLWMLSLGYLLDIPNDRFNNLVEIIDNDNVKDNLFEFIIGAKIQNRKLVNKESYEDYFGIPMIFNDLRQAILEIDKSRASKLAREFITKHWYKNHKDAAWFNIHNNKHNTFFGYWSFETAAIVKIMGLDDSSFRDCQYYPKDLVNTGLDLLVFE